MKKSELLEKIEHSILRVQGCDPDTGEKLWPSEHYIAYAVLKDLENYGLINYEKEENE